MTDATPPLSALHESIDGAVHLPGDDRYAALATPWNVAARPRPAAVVAVSSPEDVAATVRFAAEHDLPVAVQLTGHGIADDLDGALLVHTGRLDEVTVHPEERWARIGAGATWNEVLPATAEHGLAPPCGSAPGVGVVGYTTGGGVGPVARSWGAAVDSVRAFDVVTGDAEARRVTAESDPDLFWGLRGGKGSLGIVTAVELDLKEQAEVYGGAIFLDGALASTALHAWSEWCAWLPEEATTSVALLQLPEGLPGVPPPLAGRTTVTVRFVWTGDPDRGAELFAPMRALGEPLVDMVAVMPFTQIGMVHSDPVDPVPAHESALLLRELPAEAVDALLEVAGPGCPQLLVELRQLGGALSRPRMPSAFGHRDAAFALTTIGVLAPPVADAVASHAADVRVAMAPWGAGRFANFAASAGQDGFRECFSAEDYARLAELADRYDPHRLFRLGQVPVRG